jgi:hypothetical protein
LVRNSIYIAYIVTGLSALFSFSSVPVHDFHTSLTEMRYNSATKSLETTIRVFTDDLENTLKLSSGKTLFKLTDSDTDAILKRYVMKNLAFIKGEDVVFGDYLGKEIEEEVTWIYIEFKNTGNLTGKSLLNTLLFDLFDDQSNIVNIVYPDKKKTLLFSPKNKLYPYPF